MGGADRPTADHRDPPQLRGHERLDREHGVRGGPQGAQVRSLEDDDGMGSLAVEEQR
jgi:hypothetical protein